jgi:hypothetical protein
MHRRTKVLGPLISAALLATGVPAWCLVPRQAAREANWLPAPKGRFVLMLRMYWPGEPVLDGAWQPPAARRVAAATE